MGTKRKSSSASFTAACLAGSFASCGPQRRQTMATVPHSTTACQQQNKRTHATYYPSVIGPTRVPSIRLWALTIGEIQLFYPYVRPPVPQTGCRYLTFQRPCPLKVTLSCAFTKGSSALVLALPLPCPPVVGCVMAVVQSGTLSKLRTKMAPSANPSLSACSSSVRPSAHAASHLSQHGLSERPHTGY